MIVEDQSEAIAFLVAPESHGGAAVERIDTHGTVVFLVGERAYKLKRAVYFEYMDYSSVARRHAACEAEIRVNRRTAPSLYRRAVSVRRRADGTLAIDGEGVGDGEGAVVDWLVEMRRFDKETLFDRLAGAGKLTASQVAALTEAVIDFHEAAERRPEDFTRSEFQRLLDINVHQLAAHESVFEPARAAHLDACAREAIGQTGDLVETRRRAGFVRHCHSCLHLCNICLVEDRPTLFDAIEFSERLVNIDVLYDLAFLLMDLWHRDLRDHASLVLSRYLWRMGGLEGLALMPSFLSCRAGIRAHVTASAAASFEEAAAAAAKVEARRYLDLAIDFLVPWPSRLVAIGGLSGSGKTALAMALASGIGRAPCAVVLRSDVICKRLMGVPATASLGPQGYTRELTARVARGSGDRAQRRTMRGRRCGARRTG